jgi:monoamine oxidase
VKDPKRRGQTTPPEPCVAQPVRVFGPEAGGPRRPLIRDWASDPLTAAAQDRSAGAHPTAPGGTRVSGRWAGRPSLAGSGTSAFEPGFMAGAIEAARTAAAEVLARLGSGPG